MKLKKKNKHIDVKYIDLTLNLVLLIKLAIGKKIVTTRAEI